MVSGIHPPADGDLGPAHAVLWWADLTMGPADENVTVDDRLTEILTRYEPGHVVARFVNNRRLLLAAGRTATGSIQASTLSASSGCSKPVTV